MSFVQAAIKSNNERMTTTTNGMVARETTAKPVMDLFNSIGSSRGSNISAQFTKAYVDNKDLTIRSLLWCRDILQGAGERQQFRNLLQTLEIIDIESAIQIIPKIPELGRWDDLFSFKTDKCKNKAFKLYEKALKEKNGLAAKWAPREKSSRKKDAYSFRKFMKLSPKEYRKLLVNNTDVVEQKMCANKWHDINFNHVPSIAAFRYQQAFAKHTPQKYRDYLDSLSDETSSNKVNAKALYPHDVVRSILRGDSELALHQWEALPNYLNDSDILPMVDVSGSMGWMGDSSSILPIHVAVSLGLYISDKNKGPFKDAFLPFSTSSKVEILKGNLIQKMKQLQTAQWSMSTNLESAFDSVLKIALDNNLSKEDMPEYILILSDMQFNSATLNRSDTALDMIERKYNNSGYKRPNIIFWNLARSTDNHPVKFDQKGTAMVSGFNTSILKSILSNNLDDFTPENIMLETLMSERYNY